jgi:predicted AlkP superfamily phosphohydrolase/phosphomutase
MMSQKILVVALDGATFDLIDPWVEVGLLPTFARLLREGAHGRLRSVPNTDTAPAWTTFATGLNPAQHGLFNELNWSADRRTLTRVRGGDRQGDAFWKLAGAAARRVAIINFPFSYPAEPVNGVMVAGIDAPDADAVGFCHPPDFIAALRRDVGDYQIDSQIQIAIKEGRPDQGLAQAYATAQRHTDALLYAMSQQSCDLALIVYSIPDEMQHFFWRQMVTDSGPQRHAILEGYQFIERQINRLLAHADENTTLLVMSDHGFGPICATPEYLAQWLAQQGFLCYLDSTQQPWQQRFTQTVYGWIRQHLSERQKMALRRWLPKLRQRVETDARFADIDWAKTTAYAGASPWEIWLNLKGREAQGRIAPGEAYQRVREEIIARLHEWRDPQNGLNIVNATYRREEVYHGPYLELAPDITIEWNPKAAPPFDALAGNRSRFDADHQPEGILLVSGPHIQAGREIHGARMIDLAPTLLHLLDVSAPDEMNGRVLTELFI